MPTDASKPPNGAVGKTDADVTIVTVTFNSSAVIGACLASVPPTVPVVVVDNASVDDGTAIAERRASTVIRRLDRNVGFGAACNAGAETARTPYLLFLNPDARLQPDTLAKLREAADRYPQRSVFNARLLNDDGSLNLRAPSRFLGRSKGQRAARPEADIPIDVLSGAAIFIRRDHFLEIGGFDEKIFLYFEDDDLSLRLHDAGFRLWHVHGAVVMHEGGAATLPSPALTRFKNYHWMRAYAYVAAKHGKPISRASLIGLSVWRWLIAAVSFNAADRRKFEGRLQALLER